MARNKSVNETRTKEALTFYTNQAKASNLLGAIAQYGGFKTNAISIAISRGRISQVMIDAFVHVLGANPDYLTGQLPLPPTTPTTQPQAINTQQIMSDNEALNMFTALIQNQDVGVNSSAKKTAIQAIKTILNNF